MQIDKIKIQNFRNYKNQEIILDENLTVFYGDNAQGKTNILEAIFLCALGKSFRTSKENEMIFIGEEFSKIEVEYQKKDRSGKIIINLGEKKTIYLNDIKIKKLSDLLGNLNIVLFTPDDINILKGGPAQRRRFLDMMIGQIRPSYVHTLNLYLKVLEQRNTYLRQIKYEQKEEEMLNIWDEKLAEYGEKIFNYREEFIKKIEEKIISIHKNITQEKEEIKLEYNSDCKNKKEYIENLNKNRKIDILRGYTTKGIHRDDFVLYINGKQVNIYGSQGQNRTAILSLKLSELQVINEEIGEYPVLLLDDFMSELDQKRVKSFLENIKDTQVIITCTQKTNINNAKNFLVQKGEVYKS